MHVVEKAEVVPRGDVEPVCLQQRSESDAWEMAAQTGLTVVQERAGGIYDRLAVVDLDAQPAVRGAACRQERIREMLTGKA